MLSRRKRLCLALVLSALVGCNGEYNSGDRVLVAKEAYDAGIGSPQRFEVVVFKYPKEPIKNATPKNYIKRLLGLPGELIAILCGQLFVFHPEPGDPPFFDDVNNKDIQANDLWKPAFMHTLIPHYSDPVGHDKMRRLFAQPGKFEIIRKPPEVMLAMRRIVNDNDFQPTDLKTKRWEPEAASSWAADEAKGFTCKGGNKMDWLHYKHINRPIRRDDTAKPELITDFMDYNNYIVDMGQFEPPDRPASFSTKNWVGDLMLECELQVAKSEGEFRLELNRGMHRFQARFDLTSGQCSLFKVAMDDKEEQLGEAVTTRVMAPGKYSLRLANFDARLTLWVDNDLPFRDGQKYPPPEMRSAAEADLSEADLAKRRGPTVNDLKPASVGSRGADVAIHHLRVWRDTYYTYEPGKGDLDSVRENIDRQNRELKNAREHAEQTRSAAIKEIEHIDNELDRLRNGVRDNVERQIRELKNSRERFDQTKSAAIKEIAHLDIDLDRLRNPMESLEKWTDDHDWSEPKKWTVLQELALKVMYVQPGHYLCLGDNSPQSSDSRDWGVVPKRLMLGRALLVYFPFPPFSKENRTGLIR